MSVAGDGGTARSGLGYGEGRHALLEAAVHVVAQRGLRKLTYRAVAEQAGVAHGLVAHHFGTRDALLAAALEFSLANSVGSLSAKPDDQAFQYELILEARRRPELRPQVEQVYATYRQALAAELEAAGIRPDSALNHLVFAALDGLVFQLLCLGASRAALGGLDRLRDLLRSLI